MMLTELYYYCGNNPTAKAVGRVVSEVAADELVSHLELALRRRRADPANVSLAIAELASCTLASLTRIRRTVTHSAGIGILAGLNQKHSCAR